MKITEQTLVSEIATTLPSSVRVFQRVGIDFCCGGKRPLVDVCDDQRLSFAAIAAEIEASATGWPAEDRDWTRATLTELADHIVATYHDRLREELPRLEDLAGRVRRAHGAKAPRLLGRLEAIVLELSTDLHAHMRKEELVLFPAIRAIDAKEFVPRAIPISAPIVAMEQEHESAGALLAELRTITNGFTLPDWACVTVRALYDGLAELERDMHVHVHLENNVLFPGTLRLTELGTSLH
jgi:regulator of cell morphogenesis and NO signaling